MNGSPKKVTPATAKYWRTKFQNSPMILPKARMPIFMLSVPFKWMVREKKSKLKIKRVAVAAMLMKQKDVIRHSVITSKKNPVTKRLLLNFILLISFCSTVRSE